MENLVQETEVVHKIGNPNTSFYDFSSVPQSLKDLPRWVVWKMVKRECQPKPTKVPVDPVTLQTVDATDLANGHPFEVALRCYRVHGSSFGAAQIWGLGFLLGDGVLGIDLDNCLNHDEG